MQQPPDFRQDDQDEAHLARFMNLFNLLQAGVALPPKPTSMPGGFNTRFGGPGRNRSGFGAGDDEYEGDDAEADALLRAALAEEQQLRNSGWGQQDSLLDEDQADLDGQDDRDERSDQDDRHDAGLQPRDLPGRDLGSGLPSLVGDDPDEHDLASLLGGAVAMGHFSDDGHGGSDDGGVSGGVSGDDLGLVDPWGLDNGDDGHDNNDTDGGHGVWARGQRPPPRRVGHRGGRSALSGQHNTDNDGYDDDNGVGIDEEDLANAANGAGGDGGRLHNVSAVFLLPQSGLRIHVSPDYDSADFVLSRMIRPGTVLEAQHVFDFEDTLAPAS